MKKTNKKYKSNKKYKTISNEEKRLYGNHAVYSPDDILMFYGTRRKINWYLKRNLAEIISKDPICIKLNFTPKGLGNQSDEYALTKKENKCVQCGVTEKLTKHHVVPSSYKKFFPIKFKNRDCHDVVIMCDEHHHEYEKHVENLKKIFAYVFNVPSSFNIDFEKRDLSHMSYNILHRSDQIPEPIIEGFKNNICDILNIEKEDLSEEILKSNICGINKNIQFIELHAEQLMKKITDFQRFSELWRKHFIQMTNPQFLPIGWDVKRVLKSTFN